MTTSRNLRRWLALASLASTCVLASEASAQVDVAKPPANVLLLVDTSGSMEWKVGSTDFPTCNPGNISATNERSRWIELVEALTGTINGYTCFAQDRNSIAFRDEYTLPGNVYPYDYGYINPYHRFLSNGCVVGPGVLPPPGNPYDFPPKAINTFPFLSGAVQRPSPGSLPTYPGCAAFDQTQDGILDIFKDKLRFGLMTFDSHIHAGTGLDASGNEDFADGTRGLWSYYYGSPVTGLPQGCTNPLNQEVGGRNAAAPPWEGRLVAFGPWDAPQSDARDRADQIQEILKAQRPYGATPIAGLLHDARNMLWYDDTTSTNIFAPGDDPTTLVPECRKSTIILLSDGEPNLDLRPSCEGGTCPYQKPEEIADDLLNNPPNSNQSIQTLVVGFALESVTLFNGNVISCKDLTDECDRPEEADNRSLQACCTLNRIAAAGGELDENGDPQKAYFPENKAELRAVFSSILTKLSAYISTRTSATFADAQRTSRGGGFQFNSGFTADVESLWKGTLTRRRTECVDGVPAEQPVEAAQGDDFVANVLSTLNGSGLPRNFYTIIGTTDDENGESVRPKQPKLDDGLGIDDADGGQLGGGWEPSDFVTNLSVAETGITAADCSLNDATLCKEEILKFVAGTLGSGRCPTEDNCNLIGGIFHSTPVVVDGRPDAGVRDESYEAYVRYQQKAEHLRPSMLYVSSVDGFLHAFKLAPQFPDENNEVLGEENNELWLFAPPAVLRHLKTQYGDTPVTILDGAPVVKDVVASSDGDFERTASDAVAGAGTWKTVLVQGFGEGIVSGGYFALDITDPTQYSATPGGPKFLWQLTTDEAGNRLFGNGGTPAITTVFADPGDGEGTREIVVALLPGGSLGQANNSDPVATTAGGTAWPSVDNDYPARANVRRHDNADAARSFTIVRMDTGEILRTFRDGTQSATFASTVVTPTTLPAPITGVPVAYPTTTGAVADRAFVGDAEGRMWRVDMTSTDPSEWKMEVFYDIFWDQTDPKLAQPIETPPVLTSDDEGNVTVIMSSGAQILTTTSPVTNRVVSASEVLVQTDPDDPLSLEYQTRLNWQQNMNSGERVTGPMTLHDGVVYFASGTPPSASATLCVLATSSIWGLHYLHSVDFAAGVADPSPLSGGAAALLTINGTGLVQNYSNGNGIIYGVSVEYQPTCSNGDDGYKGDAYAGILPSGGTYRTTRETTRGKAFLVYQVGGVASGTSTKGVAEVPLVKQELERPEKPAVIESWALVSE